MTLLIYHYLPREIQYVVYCLVVLLIFLALVMNAVTDIHVICLNYSYTRYSYVHSPICLSSHATIYLFYYLPIS